MAINPAIQQQADRIQAARAGRQIPPPQQDIPEQPSDDAQIIEEVKTLLGKATELLANIGPGAQ